MEWQTGNWCVKEMELSVEERRKINEVIPESTEFVNWNRSLNGDPRCDN